MEREEAIERIKTRFDKWALDNEDMKAIQTLIPELAESEDEKIRKVLVEYFNGFHDRFWEGLEVKKVIAYLERQKEQKPAEWSEEDERRLNFCINACKQAHTNSSAEYGIEWLKSLRPRQKYEWDKTDEEELIQIIER